MTDQGRAYMYGAATVGIWSTVATAFKLALRHLDPLQLLLVATIVSLLVLLTVLYGLLRPEGIAERALVLIDKAGVVRLVEVSDIDKRPPLDNLFKALERLAAGN